MKVGELARNTGMTVRMLHHYDAIGLLKPSGRTRAGYRQYDRNDVARLHSIQTLRQLGLPLHEITRLLEGKTEPLPVIIQRQISALEHQIEQAGELCARLRLLKSTLSEGGEPDMPEWLRMLASMSTYGKYFSASELKKIFENWKRTRPQWAVLIAEIRAAMEAGVAAENLDVQPLAQRWMDLSIRWMEGDFELMERWQRMYLREPAAKGKGGADLHIVLYINKAIGVRLAALRKYLSLDELQNVQRACVAGTAVGRSCGAGCSVVARKEGAREQVRAGIRRAMARPGRSNDKRQSVPARKIRGGVRHRPGFAAWTGIRSGTAGLRPPMRQRSPMRAAGGPARLALSGMVLSAASAMVFAVQSTDSFNTDMEQPKKENMQLPPEIMRYLNGVPAESRQFDFLLGEWDVAGTRYKPDGSLLLEYKGSWCAQGLNGGRMIMDDFRMHAPDGRAVSSYVTLRTYSETTRRWEMAGLAALQPAAGFAWHGEWKDGEMRIEAAGRNAEGISIANRIRFFKIGKNRFEWESRISHDDGKTWTLAASVVASRADAGGACR